MSCPPAYRLLPPEPFALGWFRVAGSTELPPGGVRPLALAGHDWVLWRDERGRASVQSAFCGHLGAHLGHGGCVVDGTLRCPFHHWRWNRDGTCAAVPGAAEPHPTARLQTLATVEENGAILVWWHPSGDVPGWEPLRSPECGDSAWTPCGGREWTVATHWQEIVENTVDSTHFHHVHGTVEVPEIALELDGPSMRARGEHSLPTGRGPARASITTEMRGPGQGRIRFCIPGLIELVAVKHLTPPDAREVVLRLDFFVRGTSPRVADLGRRFAAEIGRQVEEDIPIWTHKRYQDPPRLGHDDGPILRFRRWAAQFAAEQPGRLPASSA